MISSIQVTNWRAYRSLKLDLQGGTTFVVARNGVGKTSLIDAVRWALDPDRSSRSDMLHDAETSSAVEVVLNLGNREARVRRSLIQGRAKTPESQFEAWIDGVNAERAELKAVMEHEWAAEYQFLARAAFITDRFLYDGEDPDLRSHLSRVFGLDQIRHARERLQPALVQARKVASESHGDTRAAESDLAASEREVVEASDLLEEARLRESSTRQIADEVAESLAVAKRAADEAERFSAWLTARASLERRAVEIVGEVPADSDLRVILRAALMATEQQASAVREQRAVLASQVSAIEAELDRLHSVKGECPVCRRPLDEESRGHAEHLHLSDQASVRIQIDALDVVGPSALADTLRELVRQADELGDAPSSPTADRGNVAELEPLLVTARGAHEAALADVRQRELELVAATKKRDGRLAHRKSLARAPEMYRRQALLEAADSALDETVKEVLRHELGPIAEDINRRWNALFPDRPHLQIGPDGSVVRPLQSKDLDLSAFSSGEKMMAKLLVRLSTLVKTTRVPFLWIDEPLEHLDPDSRRFVGSTLAHLSDDGALSQIFVTTYEEPLARKIVDSVDDGQVHLRYLRLS